MRYIAPERQAISWDSIIAEETEYIEVGCVNCDMVLGGDEIRKSDIASMGYHEAIAKFIGFHLCSRCQPEFMLVVKVEAIPTPEELLNLETVQNVNLAPDWVKSILVHRKAVDYVQSILPDEQRLHPKGSEGTVEDRGWIQPPTLQGCQSRSEFVVKQYQSRGY